MRNIFAENGKFLRYYFETSGYSPSIRISMIKNYREKRGKKKRKALIPSRLGFLFKIPLAFAIEEINKRNIEAAMPYNCEARFLEHG